MVSGIRENGEDRLGGGADDTGGDHVVLTDVPILDLTLPLREP